MDGIWIGVAFAGFGAMLFFGAKADAITRISKAEVDAIRRKADYDFGKDNDDDR